MRKIKLSIEFEAEECDFDKLKNYGINNFVKMLKIFLKVEYNFQVKLK